MIKEGLLILPSPEDTQYFLLRNREPAKPNHPGRVMSSQQRETQPVCRSEIHRRTRIQILK